MKSGITTTRLARPDDESFLYRVFVSSREDEFALLGWPAEKVEELMRMQFDLQKKGYGSMFPEAENRVILFNGEAVGRVLIHCSEREIRMVDIAVLKPFRRQGVGRAVVHDLMAAAEKAQKALRHRVYHGELNAIRFYFALGYRVIENEGATFHMEWTPAAMKTEAQAEASRA
jgi:ribosomal protein S18 acetylase RimI-like enzyme